MVIARGKSRSILGPPALHVVESGDCRAGHAGLRGPVVAAPIGRVEHAGYSPRLRKLGFFGPAGKDA